MSVRGIHVARNSRASVSPVLRSLARAQQKVPGQSAPRSRYRAKTPSARYNGGSWEHSRRLARVLQACRPGLWVVRRWRLVEPGHGHQAEMDGGVQRMRKARHLIRRCSRPTLVSGWRKAAVANVPWNREKQRAGRWFYAARQEEVVKAVTVRVNWVAKTTGRVSDI